MEHDHDVRSSRQGSRVAGLLVSSIPAVLGVHDVRQTQTLGNSNRPIARCVIDQDELINHARRDVGHRPLERLLRVIGRHDHDHALAVDHGVILSLRTD